MRNRKTFFAAVALVLAGTMFAGDVVIFDGSKNIGEVVANPAVKREGDAFVSTGNFEFDGRWDLSKNLDLAIDIENTSGAQWIPLQIGIYDASGNETAEWMQMYTMSLPPKKRMELVMEYPRPPKHPEIAEKIKGMRASPFGGGDRMALPKDYKNILKVRIVRPWMNSGPAVILRKVVARDPCWYRIYCSASECICFCRYPSGIINHRLYYICCRTAYYNGYRCRSCLSCTAFFYRYEQERKAYSTYLPAE